MSKSNDLQITQHEMLIAQAIIGQALSVNFIDDEKYYNRPEAGEFFINFSNMNSGEVKTVGCRAAEYI